MPKKKEKREIFVGRNCRGTHVMDINFLLMKNIKNINTDTQQKKETRICLLKLKKISGFE
jgi:hypothetical protein